MADCNPQQTLMVSGNDTIVTEIGDVGDFSSCVRVQDSKEVSSADILQQALQEAGEFSQGGMTYSTVQNSVVDGRTQFANDHSYINCSNNNNVASLSIDLCDEVEDSQNLDTAGNAIVTNSNSNEHCEFQSLADNASECASNEDENVLSVGGTFLQREPCMKKLRVDSNSAFMIDGVLGEIKKTDAAAISHKCSNVLLQTNPLRKSNSNHCARSYEDTKKLDGTNLPAHTSSSVEVLKAYPPKITTAPLGSSENPIQIIQQGNTYHSTQTLTQAQLQQIAHVLQQQQQTNKVIQNGGKAVLFDQATNTRIIYRVIYPSELQAKDNSPESQSSSKQGCGSYRGRGRARKGWAKRIVDDTEKGNPALSKVEREEKKKHRPRTRSGRISKPPSYMVKDYKRIHHLDFNEEPYDDSDGGYSDYQVSDEENGKGMGKSLPPGVTTAKRRSYSCAMCTKAYIGKGGLARHYRLNPNHGSLPEGEDASTQDENSNSSLASSVLSNPCCSNQNSSIIVPSTNKIDAETSILQPPSPILDVASVRRKARLKELLKQYHDEEIVEAVMPRFSSAFTLWEFLLMKTQKEKQPNVSDMLRDFESLLKCMQNVAQNYLFPISACSQHEETIVVDENMAKVLSVNMGTYGIKTSEGLCNSGIVSDNHNHKNVVCDLSQKQETFLSSKRRRVQSSNPHIIEEPHLASSLPDQILSDVVQEVASLEYSTLGSDNLESQIAHQSCSQSFNISLCNNTVENAVNSGVLFDLASTPVSSADIQAVIDNSTNVTPTSLSTGSLSAALATESTKAHNLLTSIAQQLQTIHVKKVQLFGSTQHFIGENDCGTLNNFDPSDERTRININGSPSIIIREQIGQERSSEYCNTVSSGLSESITSGINSPIHLYEGGSGTETGTVLLGVKKCAPFSHMPLPTSGISILKSNRNSVNNSFAETSTCNSQKDLPVSQTISDCISLSNSISNELQNHSAITVNTGIACVANTADANMVELDSAGKYSGFTEAVSFNNEASETLQSLENRTVVRQLVLSNGQVIGILSGTEGQECKDINEQLVQGFLSGNLILLQNPDGSLQVPSSEDINLETLQTLVVNQDEVVGNHVQNM